MKTSFLTVAAATMVVLSACDRPAQKSQVYAVKFPPPVVESDMEARNKDEKVTVYETEAVEEPTGNSNINTVNLTLPNQSAIEKKIIKEGDISFESSNVAETRKQLLASLKKLGGYIDEDGETTNGEEGRKEYQLSIRIPAKNFDAFLETASSTAVKIDSRDIRIRDVTTQFIDTKTRLDNKKLLELRYLDLLKKGSKISDLLSIENKLSDIRSDIESTQSQLNYMSKQVEYSSLSLTFYTKQPTQVAAGNGFGYKLSNALGNGLTTLQDLFFTLISLWPFWMFIAVGVLIFKRWRRNKTKTTEPA